MGRFAIAAKHHQTIAEIFEGEGADLEKAMQHYERAADFFKGEESNSSANKCMLKVPNLYKNFHQAFKNCK
jgi:alpha-soluble NSF attachment protein